MKRLATAFAVAGMVWGLAAGQAAAQGGNGRQTHLTTRESTLLKVPEKTELKSLAMSQDFNHAACVVKRGEKHAVITDTNPAGTDWDWVLPASLGFSPNGKSLVYVIQKGDKMVLVRDGTEDKEYTQILPDRVSFSADSEKLAYAAKRDQRWYYIVNGVEGRPYDEILGGMFTPDKGAAGEPISKHFVYVATLNGRRIVVVDDKEGAAYDDIGGGIVYSPESGRLAYIAMRGAKSLVVVDGVEGKEYDGILANSLRFSPDGKNYTYAAKRGAKWVTVNHDQDGPEWDAVAQPLTYSPNGQRLAMVTVSGKEVVVSYSKENGQGVTEFARYDAVAPPFVVFSADSAHVAFLAKKGDKAFAVVDEKPLTEYPGVNALGQMMFSPEKNHFVYLAAKKDNGKDSLVVVYDNVEYATEFLPIAGLFSANGDHFAYVGVQGQSPNQRAVVVVDGQRSAIYDATGMPIFSPDSKHIAFTGQRNGKAVMVVDGVETAPYDGVPPNSKVIFDGDTKLHFVAFRGTQELLRVEVEITE